MSGPFGRGRRFAPPRPQHRINHMIRVPNVRLVGVEGEPLGVVTSDQARHMAREVGLDLVEISASADPPVCRIMDYGKFKYEQKKKQNESRKKQHNFSVKEIRVRPKTGAHDIDVKVKASRRFLEDGNKVQLTVLFRGREIVHQNIGIQILEEVARGLADVAKVERPPRLEGKRMHMILTPIRRPAGERPEPKERAPRPPAGPRPERPAGAGPRPAAPRNPEPPSEDDDGPSD